jgi:Fe-S-cluster-containing dehydrogenase component
MTYTITNQCIGCDRCRSACPTHAIQNEGSAYWIDPAQCNNCIEPYSIPQCWAVCPTNEACVPFVEGVTAVPVQTTQSNQPCPTPNYWESWFSTYNRLVFRLKASKQPDYWQWWFNTYSQELTKQL